MAFSWKNFHWNNRLTGISKPCLTSAISWQDFRKVTETDNGWIIPNKLNPATNAVQVVGQHEGHFDGVGYGILSDDFVITDYLRIKCRIKCTSETAGRIIHLGGRYPKKAMTLTVGGRVIAFGVNREYPVDRFKISANHTSMLLDEWVDVECLYLNNVSTIKINGTLINTTDNVSSNTANTRLAIGAKPDGTQQSSFGIQYLEIDNGIKTIDLDFSTGKEPIIYDKSPQQNHATLHNMDLLSFWQQGEGKPTLALEGGNYSSSTGYIPARNDGSGLDALGNPILIQPYDWANLPLYSFRYPSSLPIMDKANTVNWSDNTGGLDWSYDQLKSIPSIKKIPVQDMVFMKDVRLDKKMQEVLITDTPQAGACLDKTKKWTGLGK